MSPYDAPVMPVGIIFSMLLKESNRVPIQTLRQLSARIIQSYFGRLGVTKKIAIFDHAELLYRLLPADEALPCFSGFRFVAFEVHHAAAHKTTGLRNNGHCGV